MVGLVMLASFMVYSFVLIYPRDFAPRTGRSISWFGIAGLLMPLGILSEVFFSVPPLLVLASGVAMVVFMAFRRDCSEFVPRSRGRGRLEHACDPRRPVSRRIISLQFYSPEIPPCAVSPS